MPLEPTREEYLEQFNDMFQKPENKNDETYDQEQLQARVTALLVLAQSVSSKLEGFIGQVWRKDVCLPISLLEDFEKLRHERYSLSNLLKGAFKIDSNTVDHLLPEKKFPY